MKYRTLSILFGVILTLHVAEAQSRFSLTPGVFFNGDILNKEHVMGMGAMVGLEYMPRPNHFFALEMRTRYGYYSFDDGLRKREERYWENSPLYPPSRPPFQGKARLEYCLFSPQIGIVPKLYWHCDSEISLFLENEFTGGLMTGIFKYDGTPPVKKGFTESIFYYSPSIGVELRDENKKCSLLISIGYSTLDFKNNLKKRQPRAYESNINHQEAYLMINVILKVPLNLRE